MTTARDISDALDSKPLGRFGSAVVERMSGPCNYCQSRFHGCGCVDHLNSNFPQGSPASAEKAAGTDQ